MSTRKILALAVVLVAAGVALTLIFGRESGVTRRSSNHSHERVMESNSCLAPVRKMFWRMTPIA